MGTESSFVCFESFFCTRHPLEQFVVFGIFLYSFITASVKLSDLDLTQGGRVVLLQKLLQRYGASRSISSYVVGAVETTKLRSLVGRQLPAILDRLCQCHLIAHKQCHLIQWALNWLVCVGATPSTKPIVVKVVSWDLKSSW